MMFLVLAQFHRCKLASTSSGCFRCFALRSKSLPDNLTSDHEALNLWLQPIVRAFRYQTCIGLAFSVMRLVHADFLLYFGVTPWTLSAVVVPTLRADAESFQVPYLWSQVSFQVLWSFPVVTPEFTVKFTQWLLFLLPALISLSEHS